MTDPAERLHPVYPAGPPCSPSCPGEWSDWHDGYAAGYENGAAAERERIRPDLLNFVTGLLFSEGTKMDEARAAADEMVTLILDAPASGKSNEINPADYREQDGLDAPADRCDRIVNNGEGEPTECGRRLPCEYHDAPAEEKS